VPSASSVAEWSGILKVDNPEVIPVGVVAGMYYYFAARYSGTTSGLGSSASLSLTVGQNGKSASARNGVPFEGRLVVGVAVSAFSSLLGTDEVPAENFDLLLEANAAAQPGNSPSADISHTVDFGPIYIGDADGNPLPNIPPVVFSDDSGNVVQTARSPNRPAPCRPWASPPSC
jgi:hypothetical protein